MRIEQLIAESTRQVVPGLEHHVFQRHDRLADLRANSMDRAEIVMMVLEALSFAKHWPPPICGPEALMRTHKM